MITSRRSVLVGLGAALITAPAIVRAGSLMPVRLMLPDPMVKGLIYQTWPWDGVRPIMDYWSGRISNSDGPKPLSHFMKRVSQFPDAAQLHIRELT